jgi:hypothetical protein
MASVVAESSPPLSKHTAFETAMAVKDTRKGGLG